MPGICQYGDHGPGLERYPAKREADQGVGVICVKRSPVLSGVIR